MRQSNKGFSGSLPIAHADVGYTEFLIDEQVDEFRFASVRDAVENEPGMDLDREIEYAFDTEEPMGVRPPAGDVE